MGARLFDNWWTLLILVIVIVLVFASAKLPDMARNLGRSARVLKSEVGEMKKDGKDDKDDKAATVDGEAREVRTEERASTGEGVKDDWNPRDHAAEYDAARPGSRLADPTRSAEQNKPSDGTRLN